MKKVVLTGGSHTGKTTLIEGLREALTSDVYFVPEPASIVITEELNKQEVISGYEAVLPTTNYPTFAGLVVAKSLQLEADIPPSAELVIMDRGLADNVAYAIVNGHPEIIQAVQRLAQSANYTAALLCDFVGDYQLSQTRLEDRPYAEAIHAQLRCAYEHLDIPVYDVPGLAMDERLLLVAGLVHSV